jgi:non-ribosomal peptide synthetase component F/2-polyprenyl-3-methyl-5-hydroxy-6-metoxy-1,4-benzoquinol methylase/aryl carrier-like protein
MEYEGIKEAAVMVREEEDGEKRLVAYFVADPTDRDAKQRDVSEALRAELITEWAMTWDETYRQRGPAEDATFDIVGWNNSYRGQPIPRDDMRVWVETTAQRILSLKPKRVWEIGCGTGLLLFRIAPQCSYYRGTDVSETVLDFLQKQMTRPGLNSLQLALDCKAAHEFDGTEEQGRFDTIVLNSVVQYFPDIEYLLMVLTGAVKSLTAGGTIFIGDVRSFPLLEALHVSAELDPSPDSRGCDELWNRVQEGLRHERELVIAQEFFTTLQQRLPQIGRVEIQLKRGRAHNELSRYRYDVTLHIGKPALPMECAWMDWHGLHSGLDAIRELLARTQPEVLGVTRIPNARVARDTAAVRILGSSDRPATIGDLRKQLAIDPQQGVEPEDLWVLENELPYTLEVRWCRTAANSCDVLFRRTGITCAVKFPGEENQIRSLENYATDPLRQKLSDHMIPELRRWLKEKLPEYMVPSAYVRLEEMPLTANGKLDRKRLPAPSKNLYATRSYEAPQGDIETTVAEVWSEVLKVERVGRHDNFFAMGGHSLLAVRLIERLKQRGLHLEVGTLFAEPTVAQLAAVADPQSEAIKVPANLIPDHCKAIMPEMLPLVKLSREEIEQIESGVSGGAENIQDIYPLAPLQEGILFHHVMGGEGDLYLLRYEFSCEKRAQLDAYLKALQTVIDRHDILRTAVVWEGLCEPVQVVWRKAVLQVEEVMLDEKEGDVAEQLYERCNPRRNRIDVRKAPMVRVHAAYDARENRWVVVQLLHHLVGDHVTLDVMREEIAAHFLGKADKLPEPQPFRNLVAQSRLGAKQAEHETFFREMLGDVEEATKPFGLETIPGDGSDLESREMLLEPELGWRIRQQGRKLKVSVASLFHLAWARVLALLSGREDVVFGTVVLGRMGGTQGGERGLGMYINTLPVRIGKMDRGVEWNVGRVQALLTELMRHEHASLSLVQRCSGIKAPAPLFAALLNYRHSVRSNQNSAEEAKAWDGIQWLRKEGRSNYPVALSADDWGDRFGFRALVPTWVGSIRMCGYLRTALASLVDALENAPETEVRNLNVMSMEEMRQVVYEWNGTAKELRGVWSVQKLFEEQVVRTPDTVAVEFEDSALSYRELNDWANRLAHSLRNAGVKTESRVGIQMRPGLESIAAALGVMKAGGAYVSLNQEYPAAWLRYMVEDSGLEVILTQGEMEQEMDAVKEGLRVIEVGRAGETWNEGVVNNPDWPSMGMTGEELAYVVYTPGPKGQPTGAMIEHRSLVNVIEWHRNETGTLESERSPRISGSGLDAATWEIWSTLCTGATLVLAPDPKTTDEAMLLNRRTEKELDVSLLPAKIAETAVPGMGRAVENTRTYILAGEGMEPVPIGVVGELYIGGAGVGRGYLNRPGLTAERFVPEPFGCDGTRMFKTGDLLKWRKDGTVEFAGRHDLQVTLRGFRVEIGEIEARLMEHAEVKAAAVVVREEQTEKRLIAYYTSAENAEITGDILRAYLSEILPVHMVPDVYVRLENMPLTAKGKADRKELTGMQGDASAERRYEAPAGELETAVAAVWAEVLNVERVGRHDDFFELGGRSLLVVQVLARLRLALGVDVEVSDLFEHPVLFDFVEKVEGGKRSQLPVITRVDRSERIPLSFAQQRLWFLAQMEGGNEAYHMPLRARLKGRLDKRALKWALDRLVQRHEVLRTSFIMVEGEPQQRIMPAEESSFELREINDSANELDRFVVEESRAKFDLEAGPLIRGRLVRESDEDHVLLITMHHIVSDGWSMGVLYKELNALYAAHVRGLEDPLPELPVQYADYAVWQQNWMEKAVMGEQGEYWRKNLLGAPELLEVPADHRRLEQQDYTGKKVRVELSEKLTAGLKELSRRQGTTLYMTLLAGWAVLLGRLSGQEDVVVGTPVANRRQVELENLIGFFVNTLVMRMDVSGRPTVGEVLERVKKQALACSSIRIFLLSRLWRWCSPFGVWRTVRCSR